MWYAYREMHSHGEVLEEGHMKAEGDKSCRGQNVKTIEKEYKVTKGDRG